MVQEVDHVRVSVSVLMEVSLVCTHTVVLVLMWWW